VGDHAALHAQLAGGYPMNNVKLEPGWLEKDVVQAARRTQELDEEKSNARKAGEGSRTNGDSSNTDPAKCR
jgi:hypothetical protein